MRNKLCSTAATITFILLLTSASQGVVVLGTTGNVVVDTSSPSSLVDDNYTSDTEIRLIEERTLTLASDLSVDLLAASGNYNGATTGGGGNIASGTEVTSFILHQDGTTTSALDLSGSVTFSQKILGLYFTTSGLTGSDSSLGLTSITYDDASGDRGLDSSRPEADLKDPFTLSADLRTLTIDNFRTSVGLDNLRVVVAAVPEPSAFLCLTLVGVAAGFRRRWNSYTSLG